MAEWNAARADFTPPVHGAIAVYAWLSFQCARGWLAYRQLTCRRLLLQVRIREPPAGFIFINPCCASSTQALQSHGSDASGCHACMEQHPAELGYLGGWRAAPSSWGRLPVCRCRCRPCISRPGAKLPCPDRQLLEGNAAAAGGCVSPWTRRMQFPCHCMVQQ